MKTRFTVSIDSGLYSLANLKNRNASKYVEELVRLEIAEQQRDKLEVRLAKHLMSSQDFTMYVSRLIAEQLEANREYS